MLKNKDYIVSQSLDYLRFPLALIVVLVHVVNIDDVGVYVLGDKMGALSKGSLLYDIRNILNVFVRGISVPIYLFISGYVFFKGLEEYNWGIYTRKIRNRVHTLLIPYFIWNILELLLVIIIHSTAFKSFSAGGSQTLNLSLKNVLSCFWIYNGQIIQSGVSAVDANALFPLNTPLWFIRDLFCVALFTPFLYYALKRCGYITLTFFLLIWLLPMAESYQIFDQFALVVFFFSLGAFMSIHRYDVTNFFSRISVLGVVLYFGGACAYLLLSEESILSNLFKSINIIGALIVAYNIAFRKVTEGDYKKALFLSSASMFVYLAHSLVCMRLYKTLLLLITPSSSTRVFLCLLLTYVIVVAILLLVYFVLRQKFPKLLTILTGRK